MPTLSVLKRPTSSQLKEIINHYRRENWWPADEPDDPELVSKMVAGSHCFVIAIDNGKIVGMGRAISDKASDAYIQDVTVTEESRGIGLGSGIVSMLVEQLHKDNIHWIGVIAERDTHPFYKGLGFRVMPAALPLLKLTP